MVYDKRFLSTKAGDKNLFYFVDYQTIIVFPSVE